MRLSSEDLRESKIFMYYRVVKRWASAFYNLTTVEVEFLMSLHCKKRFTTSGFKDSQANMNWDKRRFFRLQKEGWIERYRCYYEEGTRRTIYKPSRKCNDMVNRIYRILLGEEDIPINQRNPFYKAESYTDRAMLTSIAAMKNDYKNERAVY